MNKEKELPKGTRIGQQSNGMWYANIPTNNWAGDIKHFTAKTKKKVINRVLCET